MSLIKASGMVGLFSEKKYLRQYLMRSFLFLPMLLAGILFISSVSAAENSIVAIRTGLVAVNGNMATRLVVETLRPAEVSFLLLKDPYRLVLDFPTSNPDHFWQVDDRTHEGNLRVPPLQDFRFGILDAMTARLVIDMQAPAIPIRAFRLAPNKNIADTTRDRLVVDLITHGETAFRLASQALLKNRQQPLDLQIVSSETSTIALPTARPQKSSTNGKGNSLAILLPTPRPSSSSILSDNFSAPASNDLKPTPSYAEQFGKWVVFIDAGHGGKDPGAIGYSGTHEKNITLKASLELARQLEATGKVKVVLSRENDVYHRLRQRIELARQNKADLFISLHADAAENRKAKGVSVFTLSDKASDAEAARLAARENKADLLGGPDLGATDPIVSDALLGMFQRESLNQSSLLAAAIIDAFSGLPTPKRGHRFAGFAVLKAPDIPSVLIEMGFLTNKEDEKKLKSAAYRRDLMARITKAVLIYLKKNGGR